jgi:diguanylate cyclase (GGDEF)-like protein/PAS domain S-box-containing protein
LRSGESACCPMSNPAQNESKPAQGRICPDSTLSARRSPLSVLFVHRSAAVVERCLQELEQGQFVVRSDLVLSMTQCAEQFRSQTYDVVVIEYPSPSCNVSQVTQLLHQTTQGIPVIFLTAGAGTESVAELTGQGMFDYVEREHIANLPMAVRRALKESKLRDELEEARRALQHSQSLYRALVDNPAYGIYRYSAEGQLLDVNEALVMMLGYASKEQFLAANQASAIIPDLRNAVPFADRSPDTKQIEPLEIEWKRKDGTTLKTKLSGRGFYDQQGNFAGHEIIAVDVTKQRRLEDQLRHQASSDSLTGLSNHRRLFEVLHAEICRSKRTVRDFSLVLLDLDGLKQINDRHGHLVGNRALCRLGQILTDCCRSVDTAARHGGDEFAVVLPETRMAAATLVAHRICDLLAKDTEDPALSVSVGIACYPRDADSIAALLHAADKALYAMKSSRPCYVRAAGASFSS